MMIEIGPFDASMVLAEILKGFARNRARVVDVFLEIAGLRWSSL